MDARSRSSTLRNEEICRGLANAHSTDARRGSDNVRHSSDREHKHSFIRNKERRTSSHIFRKQSSTRSPAQLPNTGKAHTSVGTRSKTTTKIFSGTYGEHDIVFQKRGDDNKETPKYFLSEVPLEDNIKETGGKTDTKLEKTRLSCEWKLYTDGAASSDGSGAGLMLIDPEVKEYTYALRFKFETTNNEAEYEALLAGLRIT
ncbi:reverse transcriptase domain-containing protein [Tanacetum coccineum]